MKFLKRDKRILLILLISLPTLMILSSLVTNVRGGPNVPEPHAENGWYWGVDVGDHMYFEGEFTFANASTGEIFSMFKTIWIYNITSIENVTLDWLGTHQFSQVNTTQYYYNVTADELEDYGSSEEIALFGYNSTDPITHRIRAGQGGMPFILPLNGSSGLNTDVLVPIINETFYYPMSQSGAFNAFNYYESDSFVNMIYFQNSTYGYYAQGYYYDNGTLNTGSAYLSVEMGEGPVLITATMTQVFDYYITDEVQWGVNVGDTFKYDWYEGSNYIDDAYDIMVNITDISDIMLEKSNNGFSEDPIQMAYQVVYADLYLWNGTDYEQAEWDIPVGIANNFYPQYFDGGPNPFNFVYPTSAGKDDFLFMWNNDTLRIMNAPFDEIYYTENGYMESLVINSTGNDFIHNIADKTTGIVQSNTMVSGSNIMHFEIKSQTLVDWSVDVDDILYIKSNIGENLQDLKVTILGSNTVYVNLSAMVEYYSGSGMSITIPFGQPELQFYSYIMAEFERWDSNTQSWVPDSTGILAIANTHWPISPISFQNTRLPPVIMPEGTSSSELSGIFSMYSSVYDDISYTPGHTMMRNNSIDRELHLYFDETTGRVESMYGWIKQPMPGEEWSYMSIYPKFHETLAPGTNSFTLKTDFPTGLTVSVDVDISGTSAGAALIYNYFDKNPVNVSLLPVVTPLAYFDQLFANYTAISGNITMTITLPSSIDLDNMLFFFFAYNMSGNNTWDPAPPDFYIDYVTFLNATNQIIIKMEPFMFSQGILSAIAYITREDAVAEIPGYDLFLMSLMFVIVSSLIIKKVRKKNKT